MVTTRALFRTLLFIMILAPASPAALADVSPEVGGSSAVATPRGMHEVTEETFCLSIVSLYLYGTAGKWKEIAEWNRLQSPYALKLGQVLWLYEAPSLSAHQGRVELRKMWRKRFDLRDRDQDPFARYPAWDPWSQKQVDTQPIFIPPPSDNKGRSPAQEPKKRDDPAPAQEPPTVEEQMGPLAF